jgi:hypothetical protein
MDKEEKDEYWFCEIGPAKRSELPPGADFPLRGPVREKFEEMLGRDAATCSSGWGLDEETRNVISSIRHLHILDPSGEKLKKIKEILYGDEYLKFPNL